MICIKTKLLENTLQDNNIGKQTTTAMVIIDLWQQLPTKLKHLDNLAFAKNIKQFLLHKQMQL